MTFPTSSWVEVQAKINGTWTSLTTDMDDVDGHGRIDSKGVVITRGKPSTAQRTPPMQADFGVFNRDGKYISRNPRSSLYGLLPRNTEVRVSALPALTYLDLTSSRPDGQYVWADDSATLDITGDMELRIDMEVHNRLTYDYTIAGKYSITGNQRSWLLYSSAGTLQFFWSPDGTITNRRSAVATTTIPEGRFSLKVQIDVNNGAGGTTVSFFTASSIDGTYSALGSAVTSVGTTSIFASTEDVEIGSAQGGGNPVNSGYARHLQAKVYAFRMYNNLIGSPITVNANFSALDVETATSYSDGTTTFNWLAPVDAASDRIRMSGEVPKWPVTWDSSGLDVRSAITAYGPLRALNEGAQRLHSAMYRYYSTTPTTYAYWSGEGASGTGLISADSANTNPARATAITYADVDTLPGSDALFTIATGSSASANFPNRTLTTSHAFTFSLYMNAAPAVDCTVMRLTTGTWSMDFIVSTTTYKFNVTDRSGASLGSTNTTFGAGAEPGNWVVFVLEVDTSGANVSWVVNWRTLDPAIGYFATSSFVGKVDKAVTWNIPGLASGHGLTTCAIGHIAADSTINAYLESPHLRSFRGYAGETAADRMDRLTGEEGIYLKIKGWTSRTPEMGPQPIDTLLTILDECAAADRGVLAELRYRKGLLYITRTELENRNSYTIPYTSAILNGLAVGEFSNIYNDATVKRQDGGSSRAVTTTGNNAVSVIGTYEFPTPTLNLYADSQTADLASHIAHLGSWDEYQYQNLEFEMARTQIIGTTAVYSALVGLDITEGLSISSLPDWLPTRPADILVESYTETLQRLTWNLEVVEASPARAYYTAGWDDTNRTRIGSDSSTLTAGINSSVLTLQVTSTNAYTEWKYYSNFLLDIDGRETVTVTGISGTNSPWTFTITRGTPAFSHLAGVSINLYDQRYYSFGQ